MHRIDDEIYADLQETFPELFENSYAGLIKIDEDAMKSETNKPRWRKFLMRFVVS